MPLTTRPFRLAFTAAVKRQLKALPPQQRDRYEKAFALLALQGPAYPSLRTHRYARTGKTPEIWGSSASMRLRFFWSFSGEGAISISRLGAH